TNHVVNAVDEFPRDSLQLAMAELARINRDPALRPAIGQIHNGRLPSHECRQRANLVHVHLRVIAQAAFHGPTRVVVLHAVANQRSQLATVQLNGDFDLHLAARNDQELPHIVGQIKMVGRSIKIEPRGVEGAHGKKSRGSRTESPKLSRESYLWL